MTDQRNGRFLLLVLLAGLAGFCLLSTMWFTGFDIFFSSFGGASK